MWVAIVCGVVTTVCFIGVGKNLKVLLVKENPSVVWVQLCLVSSVICLALAVVFEDFNKMNSSVVGVLFISLFNIVSMNMHVHLYRNLEVYQICSLKGVKPFIVFMIGVLLGREIFGWVPFIATLILAIGFVISKKNLSIDVKSGVFIFLIIILSSFMPYIVGSMYEQGIGIWTILFLEYMILSVYYSLFLKREDFKRLFKGNFNRSGFTGVMDLVGVGVSYYGFTISPYLTALGKTSNIVLSVAADRVTKVDFYDLRRMVIGAVALTLAIITLTVYTGGGV